MITVRNNYHNTEVRIKANIGDTLSESQVRRAKRELCGISGCLCGGALGQRGPQDGIAFDVSMDRNWRQIVKVIGDAA